MLSKTSLAGPFLLVLLPLLGGCSSDESKDEPPTWEGTYLLTISEGRWSEPRGIGRDIADFVPQFLIAMEPSGSGYEVMLGTALDGAQDMCNPTTVVEAEAGSYPDVQIGPLDLPLHVKHVTEDITVNSTVYDFTLTDILPNGDALAEEGELSAIMNFGELYPLFTIAVNPDPDSLCTALTDSYPDASCDPCPLSPDDPYCLSLKAVRLGATPSDLSIEPVDAGSVAPSCLDSGFDPIQE